MMFKRRTVLISSMLLILFFFSFLGINFAQDQPKDILTIASVNFHAVWGDKQSNLERIKGFIEAAAKRGADMIVFPETALTGYDWDKNPGMHKENAETVPGPSTNEIAELTKKYGVYALFGLVEEDKDNPDTIYNSVAVSGPEGLIGSYQKMHLPFTENYWATHGDKPFMFDTPWGLVGVGICYDSYLFAELPRYYAALGARIYINATALSNFPGWKEYFLTTMKMRAIENMMFVVSSNLVGKDLNSNFPGFSFIVGPADQFHDVRIYAGPASEEIEELVMATIDLSKVDKMRKHYPLFSESTFSGKPDWRLSEYIEMLDDIAAKTNLGEYK